MTRQISNTLIKYKQYLDKKQEIEMSEEIKFAKLRRFNLVMGFLHLIQGVLTIFFSSTWP